MRKWKTMAAKSACLFVSDNTGSKVNLSKLVIFKLCIMFLKYVIEIIILKKCSKLF